MGAPPDKPHYLGHRQRLREKLLEKGPDSLADYELLELLLSQRFRASTSSRWPRTCCAASIASPPRWLLNRPSF